MHTFNLIANMRVCDFWETEKVNTNRKILPQSDTFKGNLKYHKFTTNMIYHNFSKLTLEKMIKNIIE